MAVTQYIGARYVPIFADPVEWSDTKSYEPLTIVTHEGSSYTSRQFVPVGIALDDDDYWALTGNYNAQVEAYRQEVTSFDERITGLENALPIVDYGDDTVAGQLAGLAALLPSGDFTPTSTVKSAIEAIRDPTYVNYYGADPTGETDSSDAIEAAIQANKGGCIRFIPGTYAISRPIDLYNNMGADSILRRTSVDFCGSRIVPIAYMDHIIGVGFIDDGSPYDSAHSPQAFIANGTIANDNGYPIPYAIVFRSFYCKNYVLYNVNTVATICGVKLTSVGESVSHPADLLIDSCLFMARIPAYEPNSYGIDGTMGTDTKVVNTKIQGFQYCFYQFHGTAINCHLLTYGNVGSDAWKEAAAIYSNTGTYIRVYSDTYPTFIYTGMNRNINPSFYACNMYTYSDVEVEYCFARGAAIENFRGYVDVIASTGTHSFKSISGKTAITGNTDPAQWPNFNLRMSNGIATEPSDIAFQSNDTTTYLSEQSYGAGSYVRIGRIAACGAHHTPISFDIIHPEEVAISHYVFDVHNNAVAKGYNLGSGNYNGNSLFYACTTSIDNILYVDVFIYFTQSKSNYTLPYIINVSNALNIRPVRLFAASTYSRPTAEQLTVAPTPYAGELRQLTYAGA